MAVYTDIDDAALRDFLLAYDLGEARALVPIPEGVENSNFRLQTTLGQFILTIYERRVDPRDLPFFLGLMQHLAQHGLPCPLPVQARDGAALRQLRRQARGDRDLSRGARAAANLGCPLPRLGRGAGRPASGRPGLSAPTRQRALDPQGGGLSSMAAEARRIQWPPAWSGSWARSSRHWHATGRGICPRA